MEYIHSVELDESKCIGCTDCIKRCPTEAIRVRNGRATIIEQRCVDCGLCIKVCTHKAKKATTSKLAMLANYKYKVAIPAPALYSQFKNTTDVNVVLTALKSIGFDDVFEVSLAAQAVTEATIALIAQNTLKRPIISSACPAIVRLISMRFPSLIDNILPLIAPVEAAAMAAVDYLEGKGMKREDIGIFFISPCAAKHTYAIQSLGVSKSQIDGVIAIADVYKAMYKTIGNMGEAEPLVQSNAHGIEWALSGGESKGVKIENAIAVDGVENVIKVLEEVEDGCLEDIDFIEGLACIGGCVGGPLTVVNSFVAKNRLRRVQANIKTMPISKKRPSVFQFDKINFNMTQKIKPVPPLLLDTNRAVAIKKLEAMNKLEEELPNIDCGSCGSPTCRALAEDIVRDKAHLEDCIFMLRNKIKLLAEDMVGLSNTMPQTIYKVEKSQDKEGGAK